MEKKLFTSEAVSEGHPDKICDQISDRILDACLEQDPQSRCAIECYISENFLLVGGEVTTLAKVDYKAVAKETLKSIGYDSHEIGFDYQDFKFLNHIRTQSPDISNAVDHENNLLIGAGDQGMMFGYACNENIGFMPLAHVVSQKLVRKATILRKQGIFKHARPDMKSQVTIDYSNIDEPRIDTILMSVQHDHISEEEMIEFREFIHNLMIEIAKSFKLNTDFRALINPSGWFEIGGPKGDTGLTGRKIIADTYGGYCPHGGGAFSGKDATKVDRSGAYLARYIAKNLVASKVCDRAEIQLAYAIGVSEPVSVALNTYGTNQYDEEMLLIVIRKVFDMRPGAIIENFKLRNPSFKYGDTANYGHFGRLDLDLPWEKTDKVEEIINELKSLI